MRVVDLFSGLGGFSQAFVDRGHDVIRFDINKDFENIPNTIIKDVLLLSPGTLKNTDVILASPDCTYFTYANNYPDKDGLKLSKKVTRHMLKLIHATNPKYWVVENPPGRIKHILGNPTIVTAWGFWGTPYLKPTWLWGKIPYLHWKMRYIEPMPKDTWNLETYKTHKFAYLCDRDPKLRSFVPYEFSLALCKAIEENAPLQSSLIDFIELYQNTISKPAPKLSVVENLSPSVVPSSTESTFKEKEK